MCFVAIMSCTNLAGGMRPIFISKDALDGISNFSRLWDESVVYCDARQVGGGREGLR